MTRRLINVLDMPPIGSNSQDVKRSVEQVVMPDHRQLIDKFTTVIAENLHWQDHIEREEFDLETVTYTQVMTTKGEARERYQNDPWFHARVQALVAALVEALNGS